MDPIEAVTTTEMGGNSSDLPSSEDVLSLMEREGIEMDAEDPEDGDLDLDLDGDPEGDPEGEGDGDPEDGAETEVASEEDVSGDGTPAEDDKRSKFVPRDRLDKAIQKRREAEERLQQFEALEAWKPAIDRLGQLMPPEDVVAQIEQFLSQTAEAPSAEPAPAATPSEPQEVTDAAVEAAFHAKLAEQGYEPGDLDGADYWANRAAFEEAYRSRAELAQIKAAMAAQEQATAQARAEADAARQAARHQMELQKVVQEHPQFRGEKAQRALTAYSLGFGMSLADAAKDLSSEFTTAFRNDLAEAAVRTAEETQRRPATGKGRAPSPARTIDYSSLDSDELAAHAAEMMKAVSWDD